MSIGICDRRDRVGCVPRTIAPRGRKRRRVIRTLPRRLRQNGECRIPPPRGRREFTALEPPAAGVLRAPESERFARVYVGSPNAKTASLQALSRSAQRRQASRDRDRRTYRLLPARRTLRPDRQEPVAPHLLQGCFHAAGAKRTMPEVRGRRPRSQDTLGPRKHAKTEWVI